MRIKGSHFWRIPGRATLAVVVVLTGSALSAGCSRTDDGSILMQRPSMSLGFGRLGERMSLRSRARARQQAQLTAFPAPPPAAAQPVVIEAPVAQPVVAKRRPRATSTPRRATPVNPRNFRAPRVAVKAPFGSSTATKPLACTDMAQAAHTSTGRVKVSCQ